MTEQTKSKLAKDAPPRRGKYYLGVRADDGSLVVWVSETGGSERPLPHLKHHSVCFECGYNGSGPSDLALAMCADALGPEKQEHKLSGGGTVGRDAWAAHVVVRERIVAILDRQEDWEVHEGEVLEVMRETIQAQKAWRK
jgi:hypothetical protein